MRAIHIIALLPVITVLCWGQEEGARPKRIGVRAWRLAVVIPKRRAEPERRTGHGAAGQLRAAIPRWQQACLVRRNQLSGQSASRSFFERHVSYSKLRQSLCHARCAAESFSEVKELAVPGHRRRIRGL